MIESLVSIINTKLSLRTTHKVGLQNQGQLRHTVLHYYEHSSLTHIHNQIFM